MKRKSKILFFHSLFTFFIIILSFVLVFIIWYPYPLNISYGVGAVYALLIALSIIFGPILTIFVYKDDFFKFFFDVTVILILQISAYIFGLYVLAQGRPIWKVFVVDDIELVSPIDLHEKGLNKLDSKFRASIFQRPQWVSAIYSKDLKLEKLQKEDEMFNGISLATRPETFQLLNYRDHEILRKLKPMNDLFFFNKDESNKVEKILYANPQAKGWLPVKSPKVDMVALFDKNGVPIKIVNLRPWL